MSLPERKRDVFTFTVTHTLPDWLRQHYIDAVETELFEMGLVSDAIDDRFHNLLSYEDEERWEEEDLDDERLIEGFDCSYKGHEDVSGTAYGNDRADFSYPEPEDRYPDD